MKDSEYAVSQYAHFDTPGSLNQLELRGHVAILTATLEACLK